MLEISEVFTSLQGESTYAGLPCTFIRLSGCNLACPWCDTEYARIEGGRTRSVEDLVEEALAREAPLVCLTGGEPLRQEETPALAAALAEEGLTVTVETNGTLDISALAPPAIRIVDLKPPSSGHAGQIDWANIERLRRGDELKIPVADRTDFEWACAQVRERGLSRAVTVLFTAVQPRLSPGTLADWILAERAPVRLQVQLHRILWPDRARGY